MEGEESKEELMSEEMVDFLYNGWVGNNTYSESAWERTTQDNVRFGADDTDYEETCPYVDMLPDESDHEHGSPVRI